MADALTLLTLILIANGAPILVRHVPWLAAWEAPLDAGRGLADGRRLLGASKTWRGLFAAVLCTTLAAPLLEADWYAGLLVACLAMLGDSLSSFIKRRFGMASGAMALGLDQLPEALLPALYWRYYTALDWQLVMLVVVVFFMLELGLSRLLFRLGIRRHPY